MIVRCLVITSLREIGAVGRNVVEGDLDVVFPHNDPIHDSLNDPSLVFKGYWKQT